MYPIRYIHAADLHLDAAFKGLTKETVACTPDMAAKLHAATFTALDRLFTLCEKEKVDFLVIAGDIYNAEDHSLKAQLALRDGCERLAAHGIRVFLAHGNHDPLSSRLLTLRWPDNVTIFGDQVESHMVMREGSPVAIVHGISHSTDKEGRNLAQAFHRVSTGDVIDKYFQLGILHCTIESSGLSERYAPCSLDDLKASGLDAWALGHIHEKQIINKNHPFVQYPGNTQGLHINETGPRGCMLVTVTPKNNSFECETVFHSLAPVQWAKIELSLSNLKSLSELESMLTEALELTARDTGAECQSLVTRIRLTGRTNLDCELRIPGILADMADKLRDNMPMKPAILLKDIILDTRPAIDMANMQKRDDLLGETLRLAEDINQSPDTLRNLAYPALETLYKHQKMRKLTPSMPTDTEIASFIDDARQICIDLMEVN